MRTKAHKGQRNLFFVPLWSYSVCFASLDVIYSPKNHENRSDDQHYKILFNSPRPGFVLKNLTLEPKCMHEHRNIIDTILVILIMSYCFELPPPISTTRPRFFEFRCDYLLKCSGQQPIAAINAVMITPVSRASGHFAYRGIQWHTFGFKDFFWTWNTYQSHKTIIDTLLRPNNAIENQFLLKWLKLNR